MGVSTGNSATPASSKRARAPPVSEGQTHFLYLILKQLDLKTVNWQDVADGIGIKNGHAARMRWSRFKSHTEGSSTQLQKKQQQKKKNSGESKDSDDRGVSKKNQNKDGFYGGFKRGYDMSSDAAMEAAMADDGAMSGGGKRMKLEHDYYRGNDSAMMSGMAPPGWPGPYGHHPPPPMMGTTGYLGQPPPYSMNKPEPDINIKPELDHGMSQPHPQSIAGMQYAWGPAPPLPPQTLQFNDDRNYSTSIDYAATNNYHSMPADPDDLPIKHTQIQIDDRHRKTPTTLTMADLHSNPEVHPGRTDLTAQDSSAFGETKKSAEHIVIKDPTSHTKSVESIPIVDVKVPLPNVPLSDIPKYDGDDRNDISSNLVTVCPLRRPGQQQQTHAYSSLDSSSRPESDESTLSPSKATTSPPAKASLVPSASSSQSASSSEIDPAPSQAIRHTQPLPHESNTNCWQPEAITQHQTHPSFHTGATQQPQPNFFPPWNGYNQTPFIPDMTNNMFDPAFNMMGPGMHNFGPANGFLGFPTGGPAMPMSMPSYNMSDPNMAMPMAVNMPMPMSMMPRYGMRFPVPGGYAGPPFLSQHQQGFVSQQGDGMVSSADSPLGINQRENEVAGTASTTSDHEEFESFTKQLETDVTDGESTAVGDGHSSASVGGDTAKGGAAKTTTALNGNDSATSSAVGGGKVDVTGVGGLADDASDEIFGDEGDAGRILQAEAEKSCEKSEKKKENSGQDGDVVTESAPSA